MRPIKVDFFIGRKTEELYGVSRYIQDVYQRNKDIIDFKIISYSCNLESPFLRKAKGALYYPFIAYGEKRRDSVKHMGSLVEASLLNYFDLSPSIVTCYDIFPLLPRQYPYKEGLFLRFAARGMTKADRIITISRFSKQEIVRVLGYPQENIDVVYPGIDHHRYKPGPKQKSIMQKYGLGEKQKVVLYVGLDQSRKNLPTLIKAFGRLKECGLDICLLKVGRQQSDQERKKLLELIEELQLQEDVKFTGYVPEDDLPHVYNSADVLVFPSTYEGFGLPPLEAMACGCPVITSSAAALPEVVGDAAIMLEPYDIEGLAGKMYEVLTSQEIRKDMISKGLERAREFDWGKTAHETAEIYERMRQ